MKTYKHAKFIGTDMNEECDFILKILNAAECALTPNTLFAVCKEKGFYHRTCQQAVWHLAAEKYLEFTPNWSIKAL